MRRCTTRLCFYPLMFCLSLVSVEPLRRSVLLNNGHSSSKAALSYAFTISIATRNMFATQSNYFQFHCLNPLNPVISIHSQLNIKHIFAIQTNATNTQQCLPTQLSVDVPAETVVTTASGDAPPALPVSASAKAIKPGVRSAAMLIKVFWGCDTCKHKNPEFMSNRPVKVTAGRLPLPRALLPARTRGRSLPKSTVSIEQQVRSMDSMQATLIVGERSLRRKLVSVPDGF